MGVSIRGFSMKQLVLLDGHRCPQGTPRVYLLRDGLAIEDELPATKSCTTVYFAM